MLNQITIDNFPIFAEIFAKEMSSGNLLQINSPKKFLPASQQLNRPMALEAEEHEQILLDMCNFLNYERTKILSTTLKEGVKEMCVGRLCQALGVGCAYNFKNEFFNFFSCIMGEVISNKLGYNLDIDEYNLKYIKVENINLINLAQEILENSSLDEAFIKIYNLALKFKHLIAVLKRK